MILRIASRVVAGLLLATGLAAVPATPSIAGGPTVSVADMRFTPASLKTSLGSTVRWSFPDPMVAHTTTSNQGFWNSGPKSGGATYVRTFGSAGSFAYHCSIHPMMKGTVQVPVTRTGSSGSGWTLRWATAAGTGGTTYDVQVRKGTGAWQALKTDTTAPSAGLKWKGSWSVRARTSGGSGTSGWSPVVVVKTL
jgi:plastocyanin